MDYDLVQIREFAKEEDETWDFREFLKWKGDLATEEIDELVFEAARQMREAAR